MVEQIVVHKVSKSYSTSQEGGKKLRVLDNLSFKINKGEFVSILGPNGCGKSTLLRLIAGIDAPDSGYVKVFGQEAKKIKVGYLPQNSTETLLPWLNVKENVALSLNGASDSVMKVALSKLEEFWLKDYSSFYPYQLSGGIKQLVGIARGSAASNLLLFDEPLSGLDQSNSKLIEGAFFKLREQKTTALMVSHDIDAAILFSDTLIILSEKPARILAILPGGLSSQRNSETRYSDEFLSMRKKVAEILSKGE